VSGFAKAKAASAHEKRRDQIDEQLLQQVQGGS
jgi:hypothetical protein